MKLKVADVSLIIGRPVTCCPSQLVVTVTRPEDFFQVVNATLGFDAYEATGRDAPVENN